MDAHGSKKNRDMQTMELVVLEQVRPATTNPASSRVLLSSLRVGQPSLRLGVPDCLDHHNKTRDSTRSHVTSDARGFCRSYRTSNRLELGQEYPGMADTFLLICKTFCTTGRMCSRCCQLLTCQAFPLRRSRALYRAQRMSTLESARSLFSSNQRVEP